MPPAVLFLKHRFAAATADRRHAGQVALLAVVHLPPFTLLLWPGVKGAAGAAFVLAWGILNFFWLAVLRRPLTSGVLSLTLIAILIVVSQFKHDVLMMTATFV